MCLSGRGPEAAASVDALLRHVVDSTLSLPSACGEYVMACLDDSGFRALRATGGNRGPSQHRSHVTGSGMGHGNTGHLRA